MADAIRKAPAHTVYVANLRPQPAETEGFDVAAHVAALVAHGVEIDTVLADTTAIALGRLVTPVIDRSWPRPTVAHDPLRLASALADLVG